jgi:hypothetical protein
MHSFIQILLIDIQALYEALKIKLIGRDRCCPPLTESTVEGKKQSGRQKNTFPSVTMVVKNRMLYRHLVEAPDQTELSVVSYGWEREL